MEYLIQFRVDAPDVYYDQPINFELDEIILTLFLFDLSLISTGKKLHLVISAESKEEAYNNAWNKLGDFNNRLMFLTGQQIIISHLEFIIENQAGHKERNIFFRDIEIPGKQEIFIGRINDYKEFFKEEIDACDRTAIGHYNEALRSESPREQFRALYIALEALVGSENAEAICDECGDKLICPKCKKTKRYPRVTAKRIDDFIKNTYDDDIVGNKLAGSELTRLRASLSHAQNIKMPKGFSNLIDVIDSLDFLIAPHIAKKYRIYSIGTSITKYGSFESVDYFKYRTTHVQERFALDIPPLNELKTRTPGTRWIIN